MKQENGGITMRSTFFGLETARRGMVTQQTALNVVGHNISNANTVGYTRQRVNFSTTTPYPNVGMNRPYFPGQIGTGVKSESIQRIRDQFADIQFREQNNKLGYFTSLNESLVKMEEIMNEPSESGLHYTMEQFWNSIQTLAANTENSGARSLVSANGQMVADTFNYYYNSLTTIQRDLNGEIDVVAKEVNELITGIAELNKQISEIEPVGMLPNDLYDKRDLLVDELSAYVNISVTKVRPTEYGNALPIAEGIYNIELVNKDGSSYTDANGNPINLLSADLLGNQGHLQLGVERDPITNLVTEITGGTGTGAFSIGINDFTKTGELSAIIESYGYMENGDVKGHYPEMINDLNNLLITFANEFNAVHRAGHTLNGGVSGEDFFQLDGITKTGTNYSYDVPNASQIIKVNSIIVSDPSQIAAGEGNGDAGNNINAQKLANLKTLDFAQYTTTANIPAGITGNVDTFYSGIIGKLGVVSRSAELNKTNADIMLSTVDQRRQSVTSVSLDEEMVDMIRFQHAYNASARNITVVDEMLDRVINGMGRVGL